MNMLENKQQQQNKKHRQQKNKNKKRMKNENNGRSFGSEDNIKMKNDVFFLKINTAYVKQTSI